MSLAYGVDCQKCGALPSCGLSGWSLVEYVIFCNAFWWIAYYFLILLTKQSEEWCCRLLTFVHGCIISFTAIRDIISNKRSIAFQRAPLSETQKNYLSFMLSYFLFDFCWFHIFGNEPWVIYFHHITSIMIILKIMVSQYGGGGISYAVAGLEFTNPYLQLRWFLRTHGYLNTPVHTAVELWFFCLFSLIRTFGGTILFYYAAVVSQMDIGMKLSFLCIYVISLVLQWQIIVYFRKKYWRGNRRNVANANSRVSISQYFQRRTLDRPESSASNEYETEKISDSPKKIDSPQISFQAAESPKTRTPSESSKARIPSDASKTQTPSKRGSVEESLSVGGGSEGEKQNDE